MSGKNRTSHNVVDVVNRLSTANVGPAERKVIDYCLSVPERQLALMTATGVARAAGSSRSTVERVTRKFGFKGVKSLATALMERSQSVPEEIELDPTILMSDTPESIARKVLGSASVRARKFAETLSADVRLRKLVNWIGSARNISLFGAGISSAVAMDLHHRLLRLGLEVRYVEDTQTQYALASLMGKMDLGLFVSYSGQTESTVRAAAIAKTRGARRVSITTRENSPLGELSDFCILTPAGVGLFGNDAAMTRMLQIMLNEILFHCLAVRDVTRLSSTRKIDGILARDKVRDLEAIEAKLDQKKGRSHGR